MTTSMMHLWLRNQLLQTVPIVLILPDWQDIYSYYQFLFTSNPTSPPPPSPPPIIIMLQRTGLILLLPYKKHKKSWSLGAFFRGKRPLVIPCYSSYTPEVKPQHLQNVCPTYHLILLWIFCFMWSTTTRYCQLFHKPLLSPHPPPKKKLEFQHVL